ERRVRDVRDAGLELVAQLGAARGEAVEHPASQLARGRRVEHVGRDLVELPVLGRLLAELAQLAHAVAEAAPELTSPEVRALRRARQQLLERRRGAAQPTALLVAAEPELARGPGEDGRDDAVRHRDLGRRGLG